MAPPTPRSALHAGAEAVLGAPVVPVAERLSKKFLKAWAQNPPPRPEPDAWPPAGKSTNCHAPGWHREVHRTRGAEHLAELRAAELTQRVYGERPPWRAIVEESAEEHAVSDETLRFVRLFLSRARGQGAHRMPKLLEDLRRAADPRSGQLSQENFCKFAMAEGLGRCVYECQKLFQHLSGNGSEVSVEELSAVMRGHLPPARAALVHETWASLDPEGLGHLEVQEFLRRFDVRRLPDVRFGREELEAARCKLLEGLGCHVPRPQPHLRRPAGVPCVRKGGKLAEHRGVEAESESWVTWEAWEAYFTTLSVGIMDEEVFAKTLQDPLQTYQMYGKMQAQRLITQPVERSNHCNLRVLGLFADGSRKLLTLRDDQGLEALAGRAGCGDGQFWTWGPKVQQEVLRRLQAEGYHDLQSVTLRPT
ncbi:Hypothetical protein SCF082_LOCUS11975 [Durusdinium trenchii]|uniref:Uncharacterized protein n=1 Tax=Durusdinium trenchii TaxID=1381693 RepID=A0ABP0JGK7_9DINO